MASAPTRAIPDTVTREPLILVFDSGLGGLTVFAGVARLRPSADYVYVADDAVFPYGRLEPDVLIARVQAIMAAVIGQARPDIVVIACNTASTLVLPDLRAAWPDIPFVGTVPAVKPAALQSRSHMISVLATPGTVARDYTRDLIRDYAAHCAVTLVGSQRLAPIAEAFMHGEAVDEAEIARLRRNAGEDMLPGVICTSAEFSSLASWPSCTQPIEPPWAAAGFWLNWRAKAAKGAPALICSSVQ